MKKSSAKSSTGASQSASDLISKRIADLDDWRGATLSKMRGLIHEANPDVIEEWKWMGTPVFSNSGIICTGESYKSVVKLTFAKGAFLNDPARLFNSSLEGNVRRAIDIKEGEDVDATAFKALVREAIELNAAKMTKKPAKKAVKKVATVRKVAGKKAVAKKAVTKKATAKKASAGKTAAKKATKKLATPASKTIAKTASRKKAR